MTGRIFPVTHRMFSVAAMILPVTDRIFSVTDRNSQ